MEVLFFNKDDMTKKLDFSVIAARFKNQWVFVKHKDRTTFEMPGGHIEIGETALQAAKRELQEETGATDFTIKMIAIYGVKKDDFIDFGGLYYAECFRFDELEYEIDAIDFFDDLPNALTYPAIQPSLFKKVKEVITSDGSI